MIYRSFFIILDNASDKESRICSSPVQTAHPSETSKEGEIFRLVVEGNQGQGVESRRTALQPRGSNRGPNFKAQGQKGRLQQDTPRED